MCTWWALRIKQYNTSQYSEVPSAMVPRTISCPSIVTFCNEQKDVRPQNRPLPNGTISHNNRHSNLNILTEMLLVTHKVTMTTAMITTPTPQRLCIQIPTQLLGFKKEEKKTYLVFKRI